MEPKPVSVEVVGRFSHRGAFMPMYINWSDGRSFRIHVTDIEPESTSMGSATKYTCMINGKRRFLRRYTNDRWYITKPW